MAFSASSIDIKLEGSTLKAKLKKGDEEWVDSSIDLNKYIGANIKNGTFDVNGTEWYAAVDPESKPRLEGSVLHSSLPSASGKVDACIDLNLFLANIDGKLTFCKLEESILTSCCCFMLDGTTLQAICLGSDGKMHYSEIDLSKHYVNRNGSLELGGKGFASTVQNLTLEPSSTAFTLQGGLQNQNQISLFPFFLDPKTIAEAAVAIVKATDNGGPLSRDGWLTRFFEKIPVLGFAVGGVHALSGNPEHAKRAVAYCANSTIVCAGICIGAGCLGGSVGGVIGAGIATPIAILVESSIVEYWVDDPDIKAEFEEATIGRYIYETVRNMSAVAVAEYLGAFVSSASRSVLKKFVGEMMAKYGGGAGALVSEVAMYNLLKKVVDALKEDASVLTGWEATKEKVERLRKEKMKELRKEKA